MMQEERGKNRQSLEGGENRKDAVHKWRRWLWEQGQSPGMEGAVVGQTTSRRRRPGASGEGTSTSALLIASISSVKPEETEQGGGEEMGGQQPERRGAEKAGQSVLKALQ